MVSPHSPYETPLVRLDGHFLYFSQVFPGVFSPPLNNKNQREQKAIMMLNQVR